MMVSARLVGLALLLAGCGATVGTRPPQPPPGPEPEVASPGAAAYNETAAAPVPGEPADRITTIVAEAARALGRDVPRRDRRLDAACAALARTLPDEGNTPFDLVEFAVQHQGIVEPSPHLLIAVVTEESRPAFEADLRERLPNVLRAGRYRRLGVGSVVRPDGRRVVIAFQESSVTTDPIPRGLAADGQARVRGRVLAPFTRPHLFVTRPDGSVDKLAPGGDDERFDARFVCTAPGRHQLEITADDPYGATVLANFPIFCGVPVPTRAVVETGDDGPVTDAGAAERRLLTLLNADRARANRTPLAWDEQLAAVARGHSRDMHDAGFVGHVSPTTGDPGARVARAGLKPALVLENVARAYSVGEAERGLMQSPGHRRNCLAAEATRVGIGVVLGREVNGRREVYVTELFTADQPPLAPQPPVPQPPQRRPR